MNTGNTAIASLAGQIGFEAVWIEMEHAPTTLERVDTVCQAADAAGAVPLVRLPDGSRPYVLGALEAGARIIVVPMTNTVDQARRLVEYGKYPPIGSRGFNTRTRNLGFGLLDPVEAIERANRRSFLFAQIETVEATENLDEMCQIEGLDGIFIGPADLALSMGMIGKLADPKVIAKVVDCLTRGRDAGKLTGIMVPPGPLLDASIEAKANLVIYGGDLMNLAAVWPGLLASVRTQID